MAGFRKRLFDLRDQWLTQLEQEAAAPKTTYAMANDLMVDWSANRLRLMECIRLATDILGPKASVQSLAELLE